MLRSYDLPLLTLNRDWTNAKEYIQAHPHSIYDVSKELHGRSILHVICNDEAYNCKFGPEDYSDGEAQEQDQEAQVNDEKSDEIFKACEFVKFVLDVSFTTCPPSIANASQATGNEDPKSPSLQPGEGTEQLLFCRDIYGDTALHSLYVNAVHPAIVKMMLDAARKVSPTTPYALITAKNRDSETPLHGVAETRCSYRIAELLMACCSDVPLEDPTLLRDSLGETVLDCAVESHVSPRYWKLLLSHHAGGLMFTDSQCMFPIDNLHAIVARDLANGNASLGQEGFCEIVEIMLRAHFDQRDAASEDWRPIHALVEAPFCRPYLLKIMLALTNWNDELFASDCRGMMPLHVAAAHPIHLLQLRANQTPLTPEERVALNKPLEKSELERLGTHISAGFGIEMTTQENNMILVLLNAHPQAAVYPTATGGRLALHYAIESGHVWNVIRQLWLAAPGSMTTFDPETGLYPFLLAAAAPASFPSGFLRISNCGLDIIYELVRIHPELLQSAIPCR